MGTKKVRTVKTAKQSTVEDNTKQRVKAKPKAKPKVKPQTKSVVTEDFPMSASEVDSPSSQPIEEFTAKCTSPTKARRRRIMGLSGITETQVVLLYETNLHTGVSLLVETANFDNLSSKLANELIGWAQSRPPMGRHELHHPTIFEPVVVEYVRKSISSLSIILDFADLRRTCDLLAYLISPSDSVDIDKTATMVSRVVMLAAVLRDETYVLDNFPGNFDADPRAMEEARACLKSMSSVAKQVIRTMNAGKSGNVTDPLDKLLIDAATALGDGIARLRLNRGILWV